MPSNQEGPANKPNSKEFGLGSSILVLLVGGGAVLWGLVLWFQSENSKSPEISSHTMNFPASERKIDANKKDITVPIEEPEKIIFDEPETEVIAILVPAYELPQLGKKWLPQNIRRALSNSFIGGPLKELELSRIRNTRRVALTFDAHFKSDHIISILEKLSQYDLKATFFLTGYWAERSPAYVRKIIAEGHEIGNHTFSHSRLTQLSESEILEELRKAEEAIESAMDGHIAVQPFVRYPYGDRNEEIVRVLLENGYIPTYWGLDSLDSRAGATASFVRGRVLEKTEPGDIILMHAGSPQTAEVLEEIINGLSDRLLIPGSLSELLESVSEFQENP